MIKMKNSLLFISLLLILCISLGAVSATDMGVNDMDGVNNTQNIGISQDSSQNLENAQSSGIQDDSSQKIVKLTSLQEDPTPLNELRSEIKGAEPGSTIKLTKDYKAWNGDVNIVIDKFLTIDGQGHTIDGSNLTQIFDVKCDNITFKNINFINTKNYIYEGGAISCTGAGCSVVNCSFVDCSTSYAGGAIYCTGAGCSVVNCSFVNCSAYQGGAIGAGCSVVNCSFINCSAEFGGAIYCTGAGYSVVNCSFVDCSANGNGGAIYCHGAGYSVVNCSFVNCSAYQGGAIFCWYSDDGVINYNIFDNNAAHDGIAIYNTEASFVDCDFNFFAFDNKFTSFPKDLVIGSNVNNWVVLNISKDKSDYSVDFVSNDGSALTNSMPDYTAELTINDEDKNITIKNNTFKDEEVVGDYVLSSLNSGNVLARTINAIVSVNNENITYGEEAIFNGTVTDMEGNFVSDGDVTLLVNGIENVTVPVKDGKYNITLSDLNAGIYNVTIRYNGDNTYSSSNNSGILTVNNATGNFNINVKNIVYGEDVIINVTNVTGVNDEKLNGTIKVSVNGKDYSFNIIDGTGSKIINDTLPTGKYIVNASLIVPNYDIIVNNTSFVVAKDSTKFIDATNGTVYNGKYYSVRLTDGSGKALASKTVAIKVAGKAYNVKTDKNGLAKVKLAINSKYLNKALTVTYKFSGDNNLKASSGSSEIKVIKTPTKLVNATKLVVKKHKNFYVKLTTKSGKVLANKVITMKSSVSGKIYKMKTNSKGIAKIDLWVKIKPLGKYYKYTFKYAGSSYYNSCSKTFKIKIIK